MTQVKLWCIVSYKKTVPFFFSNKYKGDEINCEIVSVHCTGQDTGLI